MQGIVVPWLPNKVPDFNLIENLLTLSVKTNHFTNNGPCVQQLERELRDIIHVAPDKAIILCCNGAAALHALVVGIDEYLGTKTRYATQAFTFPCATQGPLQDSVICDIDVKTGCLDLMQVPMEAMGVIITNVLGNVGPLDEYEKWAKDTGRILLFDNAATPYTFYKGKNCVNYGNGCIISFHHTKPLGFGEGGAIIVDHTYEPAIRKMINFGYDMVKMDQQWLPQGNNYKMSDVAVAFILAHLRSTFHNIVHTNQKLRTYWMKISKSSPAISMFPNYCNTTQEQMIAPCLTLILPRPFALHELPPTGMMVRKYYKPLTDAPQSNNIYQRILCVPIHSEVTELHLDRLYALLCGYFMIESEVLSAT